jgi:hypothetical protein
MKSSILLSLALISALLVGCGGDSDLPSFYDGSGESGSDSLSITKTTGDNFKIVWNKNSTGYSEVDYTDGSYFLNDNVKKKQTVDCTVIDASADSIRYKCESAGFDKIGRGPKNFTFDSGKNYEFWVNLTTKRKKQTTAATIKYDGTSQHITIN